MELTELVRAIMSGNLLEARQWVADARRAGLRWQECERPSGLDDRAMTIAAGLTELLATRSGEQPPMWTIAVGTNAEPVFLDPGIEKMPRTLAFTKANAPEPLRKRNLFAMPNFLDIR
jgi:hypothetical protein